MGKRESYAPGTFCWVDLTTTDAEGAKAFYGELFGWEADDMPASETETYTMLRRGDDYVGGLFEMDARQREEGVSPHWLSYVSVEDASAAAARASELGGTVHGGAFDVLDAGRMALVDDPSGARLALWEPMQHAGAGRVNDPGCLTWNDLQTTDPSPAAGFYAALLGWEMEPIEDDGKVVYVTIKNGGSSNGGIMPSQNASPPFWLAYFTVASCEDTMARAQEMGGEVLAGPLDIGAGRISVLSDPQGAVFAIYEGETDD